MQRPSSISTSGILPSTNNWNSGAFAYDGVGNIRSIGAGATKDQFRYDGVSRLVEASIFGYGSQSANFDPYGNITSLTTAGSTVSLDTSTTTNRLTPPPPGFAIYDVQGNLENWNGVLYHFDTANRMLRTQNGTEDWLFVYGPGDERVLAYAANGAQSGAYLYTLHDFDGKAVRQYRDQTALKRVEHDYIYRGDQLLADEVYQQGVRHFTLDHLGSPRVVTNSAKNARRLPRLLAVRERGDEHQPGRDPHQVHRPRARLLQHRLRQRRPRLHEGQVHEPDHREVPVGRVLFGFGGVV